MESVLNLAWGLLATLMFCLWLRLASGIGADRRGQLVALAVLLLILFPVISVTDDLQAAQNPAEADCCLRRDHVWASSHSLFPAEASLPKPAFDVISIVIQGFTEQERLPARFVDHPALASIQNRPPPRA